MIGIALINECIKNNVEVLAIVRRQSTHLCRLPESDLVKIFECNLNELHTITDVKKKYDVFYHFAWDHTSKENRDNPILQEYNIKYTLDAVMLAKRLGCHKFIGAGSQAEYGRVDSIITPDTDVKPVISYGIAKYAAGELSGKLCRQQGMIHIWGRVFSVYGRYDNEGTMLVYAIDQFLKGETAKFSSATQLWDYLHEDDAGKIFYLIGQCIENDQVYCIASGRSKPLKDFILELKDIFGSAAKCEFAEKTDEGSLISLQADIRTLIEDIEFTPQTMFRKGIEDMVQYRKQILGRGQKLNPNGSCSFAFMQPKKNNENGDEVKIERRRAA